MKKSKFEDFIDTVKFYWDEYIETPFYNFKWFCFNVKLFWNDLKAFRPWDHNYCVDIYCTALEALKEDIYRNSYEISETKMRKVEAMEELLMLLQMKLDDNFDCLIEHKKNGLLDFNKFNKAVNKGEALRRKRILRLLTGQDNKEIKKLYDAYKEKEKKLSNEHPIVYKTFNVLMNASETVDDGTGMDCWWD